MLVRRPRGYYGDDHLITGADILAVHKILKLPEQVLGQAQARRLEQVDPNEWYPIEWLLDLMAQLETHLGPYALMRLGRTLFNVSHRDRVLIVAKSAKDIIYAMDGIYHHSNRGRGIGGWKVLKFESGLAELETNTAHHCLMEQGLLTEALTTVGIACNVVQTRCFREGADTCIFEVTTAFVDRRWTGESPKA